MISVKICGITNESDLAQAVEAGADMVGFVVVEASPRYVDFAKAQVLIRKAAELGAEPWVVATLAVPWLDKLVDETPEIGAVQLHGKETPGQVAHFARRHQLVPVIKAMGICRPSAPSVASSCGSSSYQMRWFRSRRFGVSPPTAEYWYPRKCEELVRRYRVEVAALRV